MKQYDKLKTGQLYSDIKVTVSEELEKKLENVKSSPIKLEKAMKAIKKFDLRKIRSLQSSE